MPYVPVEKDKRIKGEQAKTEWVKFRVSPKELDAMRRLAQKAGVTLSDWIRTRATSE